MAQKRCITTGWVKRFFICGLKPFATRTILTRLQSSPLLVEIHCCTDSTLARLIVYLMRWKPLMYMDMTCDMEICKAILDQIDCPIDKIHRRPPSPGTQRMSKAGSPVATFSATILKATALWLHAQVGQVYHSIAY